MAIKLQTLLPPTHSGRTFYIASYILGIGAAVQLLLMGVFLMRGGVIRHAPLPSIAFAETLQPVMPAPEPTALTAPTPAPTNAVPPAPAVALPEGGLARPTPATEPASEGAAANLIEQARQLRQRGDMPSALARLREAQVAEPDNPQIIAETALTFESMQLPDRAFEQWQRLGNMGESVGALFYLAQSRLHAAPGSTPPGPNSTDASQSGASTYAAAPGSALAALQESTVLKITDMHLEEIPDPAAEQKFVLRIVVKDRPGSAIDPTKVRILTYFYDKLDDKDAVLTNAQTDFAWVTPAPINWAGDKSEVLETTYFRPKADPNAVPSATDGGPLPTATPHSARRGAKGSRKPDADNAAPTPAGAASGAPTRTYYGYVVRLYYDRQLQDVKGDPVRLLQQYPPPLTLPAE